ncbi:uncharacterized protein MELLADRAFT_62791 [Melampsora larici-populina 98AG31]|uniref:Uncharacterized protein n=1 Tax=Melampsora larici-populina (strain 98AG31 / pathotype 3-4-7) TaxID=747676 RepID=F4RK92_MELLP|nr:uncharacterized protein MELLADRAFT_62791 [Melampsora larici-populina 98AG31]EGG07055.1 hypothetical protein MELLADRAFT_62791 [Melampsora larici-populina 98AG31]
MPSFFSKSAESSSPSQPYFLIHLLSLASQIFINITIAITSSTKIRPIIFSDFNIAYYQAESLTSKAQVSAMKSFDVTLRQIFNPRSTQLNFPLNALIRSSRSLKAIRTSTSYRASRLAESSDVKIQHDHNLPIGCNLSQSTLFRPFKMPSPIFIRRSCPPSDSYLRSLNDHAESRNLQLRHTDPDDFLDQPNRDRRSYLVKAFRQRIARHAKILVVDDEDDLGPIDPSWL